MSLKDLSTLSGKLTRYLILLLLLMVFGEITLKVINDITNGLFYLS